jgi:alanyl-tRNA synthetase
MKNLKSSNDIREAFLRFFEEADHTRVPSSSLIPANDPSLLFTNAGMVQFKDVFLGQDKRPYVRAASSQCCVRAGGKHNDLENVGYTARHHTFFEMLGNFSFGDYFKREAIQYSWDFLVNVLGLPAEKLWITVFEDDQEAEDIWLKEMKIDPKRFSRCGEKDNFWSMGDTGPCGPCSEIFYDHGPEIPGGPPGSPDEDADRYIEIWNMVFMQYNRSSDGKLTPLPKPSVDTGMGLERIAAVVQGVHSNYEIDMFRALIKAGAKAVGTEDLGTKSLRVIADHIRSCSFLICDGVRPSNEGRGYVLRRIIRRAIRHGHQLGQHKPFFHKIVASLVQEMGEAYPRLNENQALIEKVLKQEEEQFARTLDQGMEVLEQELAGLKGHEIPGEVIFKLYDTYGFPVDLTNDIAREREYTLDIAGFEACMQQQRERSQASDNFKVDYNAALNVDTHTQFNRESLVSQGKVTELFVNGEAVKELKTGEQGIVVLDNTSFYAESGGQVGDLGLLENGGLVFAVKNTTKQGKSHLHHGMLQEGMIKIGDTLQTKVDQATREATVLNHSATHLLHAALRQVLGSHVVQKGSLVAPDRLRFDFAHTNAVTRDELKAIENLVNEKIREDAQSHVEEMDTEQALKSGALALFGEKYDEKVRVLEMAGGFSKELCGGTHVERAGQVGFFKITGETGIAAGVRRIEALTGQAALDYVQDNEDELHEMAVRLKTQPAGLPEKIAQLLEKYKQLERENKQLKQDSIKADIDAEKQFTVDFITTGVPGDSETLRAVAFKFLEETSTEHILTLVNENKGKLTIVIAVTPGFSKKVSASDLMKFVTEEFGGRGGGKPQIASGGGHTDLRAAELKETICKRVEEFISGKI